MAQCDSILMNGVFNTIVKNTTQTVSDQYVEWLKRASFQEMKSATGLGLGIAFPIEGVPVEFKLDFTQQEYDSWREAIDQGKIRNLSASETQTLVEKSVDQGIVEAWLECTKSFGLLDYQTIGTDGRFSVFFRYSPNNVDDHEPKILEPLIVAGARAVNPPTVGTKVPFGGFTVLFERSEELPGFPEATYALNTEKGSAAGTIPWIIKKKTPKLKGIKIFHTKSGVASWPSVDVSVPEGYKMLGGGARVNWSGESNLLTGCYPAATNRWRASGKDHERSSPASIDGWAIALEDPDDKWEIIIEAADSDRRPHPERVVSVPNGFAMVGGGVKANWNTAGQLLTESIPVGRDSWSGKSKDHVVPEPSTLSTYVIGIRPRNGGPNIEIKIRQTEVAAAPHPEGRCPVPDGCRLVGGGARVNWTTAGNLLTATYPEGNAWVAKAKDHTHTNPSSLTIFSIGIPNEYFG